MYNNKIHPACVLQCENLAKTFHDGILNVEVLRKVELMIKPAERIAIVGASGSGKSTLLHLLGGLDAPTAGSVSILGEDVVKMSEAECGRVRNQSLGFVYQFHHLLPEFSALDNVAMPLLIRRMPRNEACERAAHLLGEVGLG